MSETTVPADIIKSPSPNWNDRPEHGDQCRPLVDTVILHYTGMRSGNEALERLCCADSGVSAHYLIEENGDIYELVAPEKRAWHAGVSCWQGRENINDTSIGIEIVNPGHEFGYRDFPEQQISRLIELLGFLKNKFDIPAARFLGHSDVAPARKQDPGELFPWRQLAAYNFGLATSLDTNDATIVAKKSMVGPDVTLLNQSLVMIGYAVSASETFSQETFDAVTAFQRHWRPERVDGQLDKGTLSALKDIASKMDSHEQVTASEKLEKLPE